LPIGSYDTLVSASAALLLTGVTVGASAMQPCNQPPEAEDTKKQAFDVAAGQSEVNTQASTHAEGGARKVNVKRLLGESLRHRRCSRLVTAAGGLLFGSLGPMLGFAYKAVVDSLDLPVGVFVVLTISTIFSLVLLAVCHAVRRPGRGGGSGNAEHAEQEMVHKQPSRQ
jgi:hypothetical protein